MDEEPAGRTESWARRHRGLLALVGAVAAAVVIVPTFATWLSGGTSDGADGLPAAEPSPAATDEMCAPSSKGEVPSGWGDSRPIYEGDRVLDHLTFNSRGDNEVVGDERNWVRIRPARDDGAWQGMRIEAVPGQTYTVSAYVHLDGPAEQTATGTTAAFNVPTCTGHLIALTGFIESVDAYPMQIWDGVELWAREDFNLAFVPDSTILENNFGTFPLSDDILFGDGVPIGVEHMDGIYKPGEGNDAYISFKVKPQFAQE